MLVLHAGVMRRALLLLPEALPAEAAHAGHQCSVRACSYGADTPRAARVEPPQLSLHHACTVAFGVFSDALHADAHVPANAGMRQKYLVTDCRMLYGIYTHYSDPMVSVCGAVRGHAERVDLTALCGHAITGPPFAWTQKSTFT
jgi:hypothetical protein